MNQKILDIDLSQGTQSLEYTELVELRANTLQIKIKSDSYDFQSYAIIDRWDGRQWQRVASIGYGSMATKSGLHYVPNPHNGMFEEDRDRLVEKARMILGVAA